MVCLTPFSRIFPWNQTSFSQWQLHHFSGLRICLEYPLLSPELLEGWMHSNNNNFITHHNFEGHNVIRNPAVNFSGCICHQPGMLCGDDWLCWWTGSELILLVLFTFLKPYGYATENRSQGFYLPTWIIYAMVSSCCLCSKGLTLHTAVWHHQARFFFKRLEIEFARDLGFSRKLT